jgi:hypothetical protein
MTTRQCGTCSLCCKVLDVKAVYKPAGQWCKHAVAGKGCNTYKLRPKSCREFECLWLQSEMFSDEWKPENAKFVMAIDAAANCLVIHPDANINAPWRREPFHSFLKTMAESFLANNQVVLINDGKMITLLLPDQEVKVGPANQKYEWTITPTAENGNTTYSVSFRHAANAFAGGRLSAA